MEVRKGILWFRQDLRIHDNEALFEALEFCKEIIPVYVFDERLFGGKTRFGFPKTGKFRAKFIIESIHDLRKSLRARGSELVVRFGKPEIEIFKIARQYKTDWVFCNRERTSEEVFVQDALEQKLWSIGQEMRYSRGKMLYYTSDLPFPVTQTPDVFSNFRKEVEKIVPVREPLPTESAEIPAFHFDLEPGEIPALQDLGYDEFVIDPRAVVAFEGGEAAALKRLHYYFWEADLPRNYKETRNELMGGDYSTKFSPWLSQGCISPKRIISELTKYEDKVVKNESTYWIFFELLWRDFFRLMGKKHLNRIFLKGGPKNANNAALKNNPALFQTWADGQTGVPFIDANMNELSLTGFMSNRGRQNVASFLIHDLKINWQVGAEYFESLLIDYDPCSNWGNWNYIAGVGSDPRETRYFNIASQAQRYDPTGDYVKRWCPQLEKIPAEKIHSLDALAPAELSGYGITLGENYPKPRALHF